MISRALSGAVTGIDAIIVEVQCDVSRGLPSFKIVGLPEKEVQESRDRIRSAINNTGFEFPTKKITANLAPADVKKQGVGLDLPIASTILQAAGELSEEALENKLLIGELSLDGELRSVSGVLPVVLAARNNPEIDSILVPEGNANEAAIVESLEVYPVSSLKEAIEFLSKETEEVSRSYSFDREEYFKSKRTFVKDFSDVKGQEGAKRALEIAAAGGHNVLMSGPPGSGKSMLAKRLPTILPPLSFEEAIEVTKIYSIMGELSSTNPLVTRRKVRSPHHTISYAGMVGGGHGNPTPGEISLAHNGVLFLDELPEFNRRVLETLRQPLEDQEITISRAANSFKFPANFTLIGAMNPCPCGYLGDPVKQCTCRPHEVRRYRKKISGPFMDRIDIFVDVQRLGKDEMTEKQRGQSSGKIRDRVQTGRKAQKKRFGKEGFTNSLMAAKQVEKHCQLNESAQSLVEQAIEHYGFSARAYHKVLKISRTIADLAKSVRILPEHVSEAVQYRSTREKLLLKEGI
ncbi:MAG: YifB family Mg chelatase-like AAA ATPase [Candidatus Bipolaricaulota bacterium]